MRLRRFLCILGQILLLENVIGTICEEEDLPEIEIIINGDEVICDGVTEVEGNVPMSGNVVFEGPVRAAGKVTIVGTSVPMLPAFGLGSPFGPPMLISPYYFPYPFYPNIFTPSDDNDITDEHVEANIGDLSTAGETLIEGTVPITGNITFEGRVPVYGKVNICARF